MNTIERIALLLAPLCLATTAVASPTNGTRRGTSVVSPGETDSYYVRLEADEVTRFVVQGDDDGDLDCVLLDGGGHIVASDTDNTDTCLLSVTPRWEGNFRLLIKNNGRVSDRYTLVIR